MKRVKKISFKQNSCITIQMENKSNIQWREITFLDYDSLISGHPVIVGKYEAVSNI